MSACYFTHWTLSNSTTPGVVVTLHTYQFKSHDICIHQTNLIQSHQLILAWAKSPLYSRSFAGCWVEFHPALRGEYSIYQYICTLSDSTVFPPKPKELLSAYEISFNKQSVIQIISFNSVQLMKHIIKIRTSDESFYLYLNLYSMHSACIVNLVLTCRSHLDFLKPNWSIVRNIT